MKIDLHLHTTASDGTDEPGMLVKRLARENYDVIAITDHDTMDGVPAAEMAGQHFGVRVIPGIELSTGSQTEIHVLGYGVNLTGALDQRLKELQSQRDARMRAMVEKLNEIGVEITYEQVIEKADGAIGRAHLARVLMESGYVDSIREAFTRFISPGKPAFVPRQKLAVSEGIRLIAENGGTSVLAHPGQIKMDPQLLPDALRRWREKGLGGIEAYHPSHTDYQCIRFSRLARKMGLLITGGSDYHGDTKPVPPGAKLDRWLTMERDFYVFLCQIDATR